MPDPNDRADRGLDTFHERVIRNEEALAALGRYLERRFVDLNQRLDERDAANKRAMEAALASAQRANDKSDAASRAKFEDQNEFREQLKDQAATFLTRNEYHSNHEALRAQLNALENRMNLTQGKSIGMNALIVLAFGVIGAIAAIVVVANIVTSR